MKKSSLTLIMILAIVASCSQSDFKESKTGRTRGPSSVDNTDYSWWEEEKRARQAVLDSYLEKNKKGLDWFTNFPLTHAGVPVIMVRLFGDVFPDIWNQEAYDRIGLFPSDDPNAIFPDGLTWGRGSKKMTNAPLLNKLRVMISDFSCASCHTGRVKDEAGKLHKIVGGPSTTLDLAEYRTIFVRIVNDPRYKFENFLEALSKKSRGWLYNQYKYVPQELLDTKVFKSKGELILKTVKENINKMKNKLHTYLGPVYGEHRGLLKTGSVGGFEAFGSVAAKMVPDEGVSQDFLDNLFAPGPAIVDYMSVWNQRDRDYAQWDGNIKNKLIRNLGPGLASQKDPKLINFRNGVITTDFVAGLPSPPYIFKVDRVKAEKGKAIYNKACSSCHSSGRLIPLDVIQTDPNRAMGLPKESLKITLDGLKKACRLALKKETCPIPDKDILYPRYKNPVYLAQKLDGIWARAPYLHNGSIPTLYHLLVPGERPDVFQRGNLNYDQEKVGFIWDEGGKSSYDTSIPGYRNHGHEDKDVFFGGHDFENEPDNLANLLEYLKTL